MVSQLLPQVAAAFQGASPGCFGAPLSIGGFASASLLKSTGSERWMSGLSRTPGKRVRVNSPSGVRIPLSPPKCPRKRAFVLAEREHRPCGLCVGIRKAGHAKPGRGRGASRKRGEVTESPRVMWRYESPAGVEEPRVSEAKFWGRCPNGSSCATQRRSDAGGQHDCS